MQRHCAAALFNLTCAPDGAALRAVAEAGAAYPLVRLSCLGATQEGDGCVYGGAGPTDLQTLVHAAGTLANLASAGAGAEARQVSEVAWHSASEASVRGDGEAV